MYAPDDDSFLLASVIKKHLKGKNKNIKILDMGTGSGIQAETCSAIGFKNLIACDIDSESIRFVASKKINSIKSNLFENITGKFDLIIFNPPYLPEDRYDKEKDTSGGKLGDETIINFLEQAKKYLNKNGEILLLLSSLTPRSRINKIIEKFKVEKLAEKKLFYETLEVWLITSS